MSPRWLLLPLLLLQVAVAIPLTAAATSGCELLLQHHLAPTRCWCKHSCRLLLLLLLLRFSIVSIVVGVEKHQYVCVFISAVHRRSTSQTQMTPPAATRCCCSSLMLPAAVAAPDGYCVALLLHLLQLPAAATAPCCCPMLLPLPDVVAAPSCCHYSLSLFPLSFAAAAAAAPYCCCAMLLLLPLLQPPAAAAAPELPPASCCWCSSLRLLRGANAAELWLLLLLLLLLLPLPPARCCGWPSCCFISNDRLLVSKTPVCLFAAFLGSILLGLVGGSESGCSTPPWPRIRTQRHDRCCPSGCCFRSLLPVAAAAPRGALFPLVSVLKTPVCHFAAFGQHPPRTRWWMGERMLQGHHGLGNGPSAKTATATTTPSSLPNPWDLHHCLE